MVKISDGASRCQQAASVANAGASVLAAALLFAGTAQARVTKIEIESSLDPDTTLAATGPAGAIKRISGRAYGELDPANPLNAIIQDIQLAPKNAKGRVEYIATFQLVMPSDPAKLSG